MSQNFNIRNKGQFNDFRYRYHITLLSLQELESHFTNTQLPCLVLFSWMRLDFTLLDSKCSLGLTKLHPLRSFKDFSPPHNIYLIITFKKR